MDSNKAAAKKLATEADARSIDGQSGKSSKTSHDAKGQTRAGSSQGAGGGKKQQRHH